MRTTRHAFPSGDSTRLRCSTARVGPAMTPVRTPITAPATPTAPASGPVAVAGRDNTTQGGGACGVAAVVWVDLVNKPR